MMIHRHSPRDLKTFRLCSDTEHNVLALIDRKAQNKELVTLILYLMLDEIKKIELYFSEGKPTISDTGKLLFVLQHGIFFILSKIIEDGVLIDILSENEKPIYSEIVFLTDQYYKLFLSVGDCSYSNISFFSEDIYGSLDEALKIRFYSSALEVYDDLKRFGEADKIDPVNQYFYPFLSTVRDEMAEQFAGMSEPNSFAHAFRFYSMFKDGTVIVYNDGQNNILSLTASLFLDAANNALLRAWDSMLLFYGETTGILKNSRRKVMESAISNFIATDNKGLIDSGLLFKNKEDLKDEFFHSYNIRALKKSETQIEKVIHEEIEALTNFQNSNKTPEEISRQQAVMFLNIYNKIIAIFMKENKMLPIGKEFKEELVIKLSKIIFFSFKKYYQKGSL
jgi:hypothetical protein